jgi:hypothetical protein
MVSPMTVEIAFIGKATKHLAFLASGNSPFASGAPYQFA